MIHFVIHVTTDKELDRLPSIREEVAQYFPAALLHVYNQTLKPIEGSIVCENIKQCGFGWTMRFLRHVYAIMDPSDLVIKIDPDTQIYGNPIAGLEIPQGYVFGQRMTEGDCCASVFYGGFQGFTYDAIKVMLTHGHLYENEIGPQDMAAQNIINLFEVPFLLVPFIELWDSADEPDGHILVWHKMRGFRSQNCK